MLHLDLDRDHEVIGVARRGPRVDDASFLPIDISVASQREGLVQRSGANAVIHAAAMSSIDACERNPALAHAVNVDASVDLAMQARRRGAKFVFISTDAVFDGEHGNYREVDATSPNSIYGRTKAVAEREILLANPDSIIARVNFYGWSPSGTRSLAEFFYESLSRSKTVNGFDDIVVSTMYVGDLMDSIVDLVRQDERGILHVASSDPTTKLEFGRMVARTFEFSTDLVRPAKSTDFLANTRGSNLSLSVDKVSDILGRSMQNQTAGLNRLRADFERGLPQALRNLSTKEQD